MVIWTYSQPKDVSIVEGGEVHQHQIDLKCLDSDALDLSGSFFVGGLDYMDPNLSIPSSIWSATLKQGFVGCLKGNLSYTFSLYITSKYQIFSMDILSWRICNSTLI